MRSIPTRAGALSGGKFLTDKSLGYKFLGGKFIVDNRVMPAQSMRKVSWLTRTGALLIGILTVSVIFAFAPTTKQIPTIFQEVLPLQVGSETLNSKAWQEFRTATEANWQVSVDPNTYIPHRIWGGSAKIAGFSTITEANVSDASEAFIRRWADLLQVEPADFVLESAEKQGRVWYVTYQQQYEGIPVFRSRLSLLIDKSGLELVRHSPLVLQWVQYVLPLRSLKT